MAVNVNFDSVSVWKFKETGLIALCQEVVDFVADGEIEHYNLDIDKAYFVSNDGQTLHVVFPKK